MANPEYTLNVWDYVVLVGLFIFSGAIGVVYALQGRQQKNDAKEYFLGSQKMGPIPVAISIMVSAMSSITYIGIPAEVYLHGPMYWLLSLSQVVTAGLVTTCFLPVFYNLEITSVYEYIDMRFNKVVRYGVIVSECSFICIYMGIIIYTPALALSTVTGLSLTGSILAIGLVCTFYTTIGGFKAVIWTDVFQAVIMFSGMIIMTIAVCVDIGGASEVWQRAVDGERTKLFDFHVDPTLRYSFWTVMIGGSVSTVSNFAVRQSFIQRYNSCKSEFQAKIAAWIGIAGAGVIVILAVLLGLAMYAYYYGCDPLTTQRVSRSDQLIPLLIVDLFHTVPGLPGLLIAGAFSASLSTVSSLVNALAAITGESIIKKIWKDISNESYTLVVKSFSAFYGLMAVGVAFLSSELGGITQAILSFGGILGAPILGVFTLGLLCPRANSKGAFVGLVLGVAVGISMKVGADHFPPSHPAPPLSVSECYITTTLTSPQVSLNVTDMHNDTMTTSMLFAVQPHPVTKIFSVSFLHYNTIDWLVTVLFGLLVSYLTGATDPSTLDQKLISPVVLSVFSCCWPSNRGTNIEKHDFRETGDKNEMNRDEVSERL